MNSNRASVSKDKDPQEFMSKSPSKMTPEEFYLYMDANIKRLNEDFDEKDYNSQNNNTSKKSDGIDGGIANYEDIGTPSLGPGSSPDPKKKREVSPPKQKSGLNTNNNSLMGKSVVSRMELTITEEDDQDGLPVSDYNLAAVSLIITFDF